MARPGPPSSPWSASVSSFLLPSHPGNSQVSALGQKSQPPPHRPPLQVVPAQPSEAVPPCEAERRRPGRGRLPGGGGGVSAKCTIGGVALARSVKQGSNKVVFGRETSKVF